MVKLASPWSIYMLKDPALHIQYKCDLICNWDKVGPDFEARGLDLGLNLGPTIGRTCVRQHFSPAKPLRPGP